MSYCRVYQDVNLREGVAILGARLVQVCEVYTHPPFPIGFFNHQYIGQPVGVVHFPNEFYILQYADFFQYSSVSFLGKHSLLLTDRGKEGDTFNLFTMTEGSILGMSS